MVNEDKKKEYNKKYYLNNKNKLIKYANNYYKKNKKNILKLKRIWNKNNKHKIALRDKIYREKNKDKIKIKIKKWTSNNRNKLNKYQKKRYNTDKLFKKYKNFLGKFNRNKKKNPHLYPQECMICHSKENIEFHHPCYDFEYSVYPLCVSHHNKIHANLKKNGVVL